MAADFLQIARDILTDDVGDDKEVTAAKGDGLSRVLRSDVDCFDDYEKSMVVLCLGDICVHRWGCIAVVGVHGLVKGALPARVFVRL